MKGKCAYIVSSQQISEPTLLISCSMVYGDISEGQCEHRGVGRPPFAPQAAVSLGSTESQIPKVASQNTNSDEL